MDTRLFGLTGRTAVVSGASRGIGEATAALLSARLVRERGGGVILTGAGFPVDGG